MIWATVSSWSCFCWLYRASPSFAAENIINLISVLTIWWCPCVESSRVVGRGCLLWPVTASLVFLPAKGNYLLGVGPQAWGSQYVVLTTDSAGRLSKPTESCSSSVLSPRGKGPDLTTSLPFLCNSVWIFLTALVICLPVSSFSVWIASHVDVFLCVHQGRWAPHSPTWLSCSPSASTFIFLIGRKLLYNVVLVSAKQWCEKAIIIYTHTQKYMGFPGGSVNKESACNAGDHLQHRKPGFNP